MCFLPTCITHLFTGSNPNCIKMIGTGIWLSFLIFLNMLLTNLIVSAYIFEISLVLFSIIISVYVKSTFWEITRYQRNASTEFLHLELEHGIVLSFYIWSWNTGLYRVFTSGVGTQDWSTEPIQCVMWVKVGLMFI